MNTRTIIIIIIAAAIVIGGGLVLLSGVSRDVPAATTDSEERASDAAPPAEDFDKLPPFSFEDYDGNIVSSSDFEGKALVVNSWATWCPFCVDELPDFGRLQEEFQDEIVVISIDRAESRERAKSFTDELGVTDKLVFLLDPRDSFYRSIGGFSMPETLFVDTDGNIRIHKRGPMEFEEMREKVNQILGAEGA